jgi:acetyltransferase-like isoleucine patch superfamily enzyme
MNIYQRLVRKIGYFWGPRVMSWLRQRWVILRNPHATIRFEGYSYLAKGFSLHMPDGGTFIAGPGNDFRRGFRAELAHPDTQIKIGAGCVFSYYSVIQCGTSVEIGDRCMFGQSSMIVDGNHRFRDLETPMLAQGYDYTPIIIEDDVTTLTKVTILNRIGTKAVVGANSVVTRPVPPYALVAGVPARVVDYFGPAELAPEGFERAAATSDGED